MEVLGFVCALPVFALLAGSDIEKHLVSDLNLALLWVLVVFFGDYQMAVMALAGIYFLSALANKLEKKRGVSIGDILGAPAMFALLNFQIALLFFSIPILISAYKKKEEPCFGWYYLAVIVQMLFFVLGWVH